jgi:3-methyl-2-oxobutanoate hydroxymethyltransferase
MTHPQLAHQGHRRRLIDLMKIVHDFAAAKAAGRKIAMVTAYDAPSARLLAKTAVDCVLVGDSVMMTVHGEENTLGATTDLMALHTRAVVRGNPGCFVVADMPFLSARQGKTHALECAAVLLRAGAQAVKIEGLRGHVKVIEHLVESGIPVMGHLGLLPQSVNTAGGYTVQARNAAAAKQLHKDAATLQEAGAFAVVLECIPAKLARAITAELKIPTIGIGAGAGCDGQVLVWHDLLGLNPEFKPRFVRRFGEGGKTVQQALVNYARAVHTGKFPAAKESF